MKKVLEKQVYHLLGIIILVIAAWYIGQNWQGFYDGQLWKLNTHAWFWLAIAIPVIHQFFVWFAWPCRTASWPDDQMVWQKRIQHIRFLFCHSHSGKGSPALDSGLCQSRNLEHRSIFRIHRFIHHSASDCLFDVLHRQIFYFSPSAGYCLLHYRLCDVIDNS